MIGIRKVAVLAAALALAAFALDGSAARAADILPNGNFETSLGPPFWTVTTSVTGIPSSTIPEVYEHVDAADHFVPGSPPLNPPGLGILLHPMKGNQGIYSDQDKRTNMFLEQIVPTSIVTPVAGRTYTFKGDVFIQDGYSGIVPTLNPLYPKGDYNSDTKVDALDYTVWRNNLDTDFELPNEGANVTQGEVTEEDFDFWKSHYGNVGRAADVASPTSTRFEIEFLNASNVKIGSTTAYDLRSNPTTLAWRNGVDQVSAVAPAGAAKIRVRVAVENMVDNCCALGQDVFFDNFWLNDSQVPGGNRLVNSNGNLNIPGVPLGWTVNEGPQGFETASGQLATANSVDFISFANRMSNTPNPNPTPPFATLPTGKQGLWLRGYVNRTQFEPDLPDVFGEATRDVVAIAGRDYTFSAWSAWESGYSGGLAGTSTVTFIKMEFLNGSTVLDTQMLNLKLAGQIADQNIGTNENGGNVEFDDWRQFSVHGIAPPTTSHVRVTAGATGMFFNDLDGFQGAYFDELQLIELMPGSGGNVVPEPGSIALVGIALTLASMMRGPRRR